MVNVRVRVQNDVDIIWRKTMCFQGGDERCGMMPEAGVYDDGETTLRGVAFS